MSRALEITYPNPNRVVDGADFDGTNDFMSRSGLSGAADSKKGLFSCWVRLDGGDGTDMAIIQGFDSGTGAEEFLVKRQSTNKFRVMTAGGVTVGFEGVTSNTYTASSTWLHILSSWDLATPGARHIYVNGVSDMLTPTFNDITADYTLTDWAIGAQANSPNTMRLNGCLAELYFAPGVYLDLSNTFFREKFRSLGGKPVHLGTNGALPTGTQPLIYLHLDDGESAANFATNRGTGGNFTISGGGLATASSSPSD